MVDDFHLLSRAEQQEIREVDDDQHDLTAHELGFPQPSIEDDEWCADDEDGK